MKKTIYLHVGHPKTASSSLQHFLAKNREALEKKGYIYPLFSRDMVNHHLLFLWNVNKAAALTWKEGRATLDKLDLLNNLLVQHLKNSPSDKIILSHESLIYNADKLLDHFAGDYHVVVIAYFRRMDHYVESFYSELISNGSEDVTIDIHLKTKLGPTYMSRYKMIETLSKRIGKENIIIRPFERAQLKNKSILEDFLSLIGIEDVSAFNLEQADLNLALPTAAINFIQKLNHAFSERSYFTMARKVASSLKPLTRKAGDKKQGSLLSYEQRMMLIEKTKRLDEHLAREYLHREDGQLFYEALPDPLLEPAKDILSADEIAELMAEFLLDHPPQLREPIVADVERCYDALMERTRVLESGSLER